MGLLSLGMLAAGAAIAKKQYDQHKEIKKTKQYASDIVYSSEDKLHACQEIALEAVVELGKKKKHLIDNSLSKYIDSFSKIKKIKIEKGEGFEELKIIFDNDNLIEELHKICDASNELNALYETGDLYDIGEHSFSDDVVTATTGAFVLQAVMNTIAGPLAIPRMIAGSVLSSKFNNKQIDKADADLAQAKVIRDKSTLAQIELLNIKKSADQLANLFDEITIRYDYCIKMQSEITNKKTDWNDFSLEEKKLVAVATKLSQVVKMLLDTPLLTENGVLAPQAKSIARDENVLECSKIEQIADKSFKTNKKEYSGKLHKIEANSNIECDISELDTSKQIVTPVIENKLIDLSKAKDETLYLSLDTEFKNCTIKYNAVSSKIINNCKNGIDVSFTNCKFECLNSSIYYDEYYKFLSICSFKTSLLVDFKSICFDACKFDKCVTIYTDDSAKNIKCINSEIVFSKKLFVISSNTCEYVNFVFENNKIVVNNADRTKTDQFSSLTENMNSYHLIESSSAVVKMSNNVFVGVGAFDFVSYNACCNTNILNKGSDCALIKLDTNYFDTNYDHEQIVENCTFINIPCCIKGTSLIKDCEFENCDEILFHPSLVNECLFKNCGYGPGVLIRLENELLHDEDMEFNKNTFVGCQNPLYDDDQFLEADYYVYFNECKGIKDDNLMANYKVKSDKVISKTKMFGANCDDALIDDIENQYDAPKETE